MLRTNSMSCSTTTTVCSAGQARQQLRRVLRLLVRHAGHRLVDQQHLAASARAACRSRATASGRARAGLPGASRFALEADRSRASRRWRLAARPLERAKMLREHALVGRQRELEVLEHGVAGTPSGAGTCGRCRARAISYSLMLGEIDALPVMYTRAVGRAGLAGDHVHHAWSCRRRWDR